MTIERNVPLRPPKAPNLLVAPVQYAQLYQDQLNNALRLYFNQIDNFAQALYIPSSGTTANRPTDRVQIGQYYFDTDLGSTGLPIWYDGTNWIDATGTVV
jgi:hypothetical protein